MVGRPSIAWPVWFSAGIGAPRDRQNSARPPAPPARHADLLWLLCRGVFPGQMKPFPRAPANSSDEDQFLPDEVVVDRDFLNLVPTEVELPVVSDSEQFDRFD